jgi:hypothetical protein
MINFILNPIALALIVAASHAFFGVDIANSRKKLQI